MVVRRGSRGADIVSTRAFHPMLTTYLLTRRERSVFSTPRHLFRDGVRRLQTGGAPKQRVCCYARSAHLPTRMGCGASKKAVDPSPGPPRALQAATAVDPGPGPPPALQAATAVDPGPRPAKSLAPLTPEAQAAAQARTVRLLDSLAAKEERVERPVLPNSKRLRSGQRGMTRALLFGVKAFYAQRGALDKTCRTSSTSPGSRSARAS